MPIQEDHRSAWSGIGGILMMIAIGFVTLAWQSGQGQHHHIPEPAFVIWLLAVLTGLYLILAPLVHWPPFRSQKEPAQDDMELDVEIDSYSLPDDDKDYIAVGVRNDGSVADFRVRLSGYHRSAPTSHGFEFTSISIPWRDNDKEDMRINNGDERLLVLVKLDIAPESNSFSILANCMEPKDDVGAPITRVNLAEDVWLMCVLYRVEPDASEEFNVHVRIPVSDSGCPGGPLTWVTPRQSQPRLQCP